MIIVPQLACVSNKIQVIDARCEIEEKYLSKMWTKVYMYWNNMFTWTYFTSIKDTNYPVLNFKNMLFDINMIIDRIKYFFLLHIF